MKKIMTLAMVGLVAAVLGACGNAGGGTAAAPEAGGADFPSRSVNGIVQWGAGGGTDSLMRPLAAIAENYLGVSIVVSNMTGATGSIATQFVYDQAADGYNLLMGAENPALYQVLGISELTYEDFEPVFIIGDETVGVIVRYDSPYQSFTELINSSLAAPASVILATTGTGGLPWTIGAFITDVTGATFNQIPYESDAAARTAVISGEADFTIAKIQAGVEAYNAGEIRFLTMLSLEPVPVLPHIPLVTAEFPGFDEYLPWGTFYGVFVRNGTDQQIIDTLAEAFLQASHSDTYQELLVSFNVNFMGYVGDQAREYIRDWQANTIRALESSGALN
ncbi:MAG: tripartite tricarboxylate transporter substrate binding protein [Defluviitaleaceae bacterium]|nr:tripartite tricarboxylate transporter substrate binding protein [Defluviitaleaceae bacterium]